MLTVIIMNIWVLKEVHIIKGAVVVKAGQAIIKLMQVLQVIDRFIYQVESLNTIKCISKLKLSKIEN